MPLCQRCGAILIERGSTVRITGGPVRGPVTICSDCAHWLRVWLFNGEAPAGSRGSRPTKPAMPARAARVRS